MEVLAVQSIRQLIHVCLAMQVSSRIKHGLSKCTYCYCIAIAIHQTPSQLGHGALEDTANAACGQRCMSCDTHCPTCHSKCVALRTAMVASYSCKHRRRGMWTTVYNSQNAPYNVFTATAAYSNIPELLELFAWQPHALPARSVDHTQSHSH